jgi:hypothetical protein
MTDDQSTSTQKIRERKLLEFMVRANARNHGRPAPDMSKIRGGVTRVTPSMSFDEAKENLITTLEKHGIPINRDIDPEDQGGSA